MHVFNSIAVSMLAKGNVDARDVGHRAGYDYSDNNNKYLASQSSESGYNAMFRRANAREYNRGDTWKGVRRALELENAIRRALDREYSLRADIRRNARRNTRGDSHKDAFRKALDREAAVRRALEREDALLANKRGGARANIRGNSRTDVRGNSRGNIRKSIPRSVIERDYASQRALQRKNTLPAAARSADKADVQEDNRDDNCVERKDPVRKTSVPEEALREDSQADDGANVLEDSRNDTREGADHPSAEKEDVVQRASEKETLQAEIPGDSDAEALTGNKANARGDSRDNTHEGVVTTGLEQDVTPKSLRRDDALLTDTPTEVQQNSTTDGEIDAGADASVDTQAEFRRDARADPQTEILANALAIAIADIIIDFQIGALQNMQSRANARRDIQADFRGRHSSS